MREKSTGKTLTLRFDPDGTAVEEDGHAAIAAELVEPLRARVLGGDELDRGVDLEATRSELELLVELLLRVERVRVHRAEGDQVLAALHGRYVGARVLREDGHLDREEHRGLDSELGHLAREVPGSVRRAHAAPGHALEREVAREAREVLLAQVLVDVDLQVDRAVVREVVLGALVRPREVHAVGEPVGEREVGVEVDHGPDRLVLDDEAVVLDPEPGEGREVAEALEPRLHAFAACV